MALRKCFTDSIRVDTLIKDFVMLRDNAYAGFIRVLEEMSPVNVALAAWICGRATANHILLGKNRMKYSVIKKLATFQSPFVASDLHDILEGRHISPNTPIIFLVNKKTDPVSTVFCIRDRILVEHTTAATYKNVSLPAVDSSLPVIRDPLFTATSGSSVKEAKEGISLDWYVQLSNMSAMGKMSAAVASGISRALSSVDAKKKSVKPDEPSEKELRKALRRNMDRSKNLLVSLGQNLSLWGYEEHNTTMSAVHASAVQEALNRGNDAGVRHQMDMGCIRDAFTRAEEQLRLAFFKVVDRPGDSARAFLNSSIISLDILFGKNDKTFKDQNHFLTLVRCIWFNMAILSFTDTSIVSAIDMTQRNFCVSIYNDYLAIMSFINTYGQNMTRFSIGKLIEDYGKKTRPPTFAPSLASIFRDVMKYASNNNGIPNPVPTIMSKLNVMGADSEQSTLRSQNSEGRSQRRA
ncbi:hypothetical protein O3P69_007881 [Scylla paramamosain]|uniref:Uncharacterized protein n=1 Tax=Scylla paramamosain TaxID=85552 RepID=A0AAW0SHB1_SCYPA